VRCVRKRHSYPALATTTRDLARIEPFVATSGKHLLAVPEIGDSIEANIVLVYLDSRCAFIS